jgi:hypothetical protein
MEPGPAAPLGEPPVNRLRSARKPAEAAARYSPTSSQSRLTPGTSGFTPIPKHRTFERTYVRLMVPRRLARDCETHPHRSKP